MFGALTYKHPINLVIAANIAAYAVLYFFRQPFDKYALLVCLAVVVSVCISYFVITGLEMGDEYLFLIVSMLMSLGVLMIYRLDPSAGQRQVVWLIAGILLFFISYILFVSTRLWQKLGYLYAAGALALNIATIIFGSKINGSTNWIVVQGHSFQLSEVVKILFILFIACYFREKDTLLFKPTIGNIKPETINRVLLMMMTFMNAILLILQKEWGTVALFFLIYLIMIYVFDGSRLFLLGNTVMTIPVALFGYFFIDHIRVRVDMWLNPWSDPSGKGYQILQSLFAIGAGGFTGTGIGAGRPDLIPAVNTDFIFSAICEEMGILCGVAVILLYFILFYRGIKIVLKMDNRFYKALSLGISVMFGLQTFIITGGVIKLIPLTGITLPFISYGGSSLITSFISLGILQAASKIRFGGEVKDNNERE